MGIFIQSPEYIGKQFEIIGLDHTGYVSFTIMDARTMTISGIFDPVLFRSPDGSGLIEDENGSRRVDKVPEPYMKDFEIIELFDGQQWYPYHKNASYHRIS
jgi:hypothetical protein